jgi:hypothetical protein
MAEREFDAEWVRAFVGAVMDALNDYQNPVGTVEFYFSVNMDGDAGRDVLIMPCGHEDGICRLRFTAVHPRSKEAD